MRIALSSYAAFDRANMLFMEALRDAALPLVKALREARDERDAALKDAETQGAMHHRYYWRLMACDEARAFDKDDHQKVRVTLTKERDEARAEVARLQEQVEWLLEGREQQEQRLALEADE